MNKPNPKLSIITINFNNLEGLELTVNSVINQSFQDFEYIIIDGGSNDGSAEFVKKNKVDFSFWVSESDDGIYDAMNKGIEAAKGQWIMFLNSGDFLPNEDTLTSIFENKYLDKNDVIYGNVIKKKANSYTEIKTSELCSMFYKMPFCHQSSIVKTKLLKIRKFDTNYKIASDYDFFCNAYRTSLKFKKINLSFAVFDDGGISSSNKSLMYKEFSAISSLHFKGVFRVKMQLCYRVHVFIRWIKLQKTHWTHSVKF